MPTTFVQEWPGFCLDISVKSCLLLAVAFTLSYVLRRSSASKRHWVWLCAMASLLALPFLGALVYLIANHDGMAERSIKSAQAYQTQVDDHIRQVAGGSASEIAQAKGLIDSGAISQAEFESLKAKALS